MKFKKVGLFILLAFAISWSAALAGYAAHLPRNAITAMVLRVVYLAGPVLAAFIVQKLVYREKLSKYGWQIGKVTARIILLPLIIFLSLFFIIVATGALLGNTGIVRSFGVVSFGAQHFHYSVLGVEQAGVDFTFPPQIPACLRLAAVLAVVVVAGCTVYVPVMFCEEAGWRGLMLAETKDLGIVRSSSVIGVTWGLWHAPLILQGGDYPGHPFAGIPMLCIMTTALSPIMAYVRLRTKSLLGVCMLHGMIDASAPAFALFVTRTDNFYTSPVGIAGLAACLAIISAIYILDKKFFTGSRRAVNIPVSAKCLPAQQ